MLHKIVELDLYGSATIEMIDFSKSLKREWQNHYEFLTWKYGKHHLKLSYMDQLHCFTFLLGGNYKHTHQENSCVKCLTCF